MPTARQITSFLDDEAPDGQTPWVVAPVSRPIAIVDYDPAWPAAYARLADQVQDALGARVLAISHVGSTAVPALAAKPVIDIDIVVADPSRESVWLPPLEACGFVLTVREPWWHEHRCLTASDESANLHVFGPDSPEPWKHRIFRDHLRRDEGDRMLYAEAKRAAAAASTERAEQMMDYNHRKQQVIRDIYARAFRAAGLSDEPVAGRGD